MFTETINNSETAGFMYAVLWNEEENEQSRARADQVLTSKPTEQEITEDLNNLDFHADIIHRHLFFKIKGD